MPTYEYACGKCGSNFEREQRMTDKPVKKCPACGSMKAKRLISGGSFILQGGGWYADGYSGQSNKKSDTGDSKSSDSKSSDSKSTASTASTASAGSSD